MSIGNIAKVSNSVSTTKEQKTNDTSSLDRKIEQLKKQIEQIKENKKLSQEEKDKRIENIEKQVARLEQHKSEESDNTSANEVKSFDTYEKRPLQQSAGVYQVTHNEGGHLIIKVDKSRETAQEPSRPKPEKVTQSK